VALKQVVPYLLTAILVSCLLASCDEGIETRRITFNSISGPDSLPAGQPLDLEFDYEEGPYGWISGHTWEALGDSALVLTVYYSFPVDTDVGIAAPPFPKVGSVRLDNPPPHRFLVTAGPHRLWIEGGTTPVQRNRLTIELRDETGRPVPGVSLDMLLKIDETLPTLVTMTSATDSLGLTSLYGACCREGAFTIESYDTETHRVFAIGRCPAECLLPRRLVTTATLR
jgi:hypothetical protein